MIMDLNEILSIATTQFSRQKKFAAGSALKQKIFDCSSYFWEDYRCRIEKNMSFKRFFGRFRLKWLAPPSRQRLD